jgi:hypothetical protein
MILFQIKPFQIKLFEICDKGHEVTQSFCETSAARTPLQKRFFIHIAEVKGIVS